MTIFDTNIDEPTILYEDGDIILLNKPSGLLSVPDGYDPSLPHIKQVIEPSYGLVWIVHRLDKETSGVMVIARNPESHQMLNEHFRLRKIEKIYHGLVTPVPTWHEIDIQLPLQTNADRKHRTRVNERFGKPAHSTCKVIKWFILGGLMEIQIFTGISHQIRSHLRVYNLAILGEKLYSAGLTAQPFQVPRTMLHARTLSFVHPTSGQWLSITAPYPQDFRDAYTQLRTTKAQDEKI
jgi:RluA family pseudouridine synthase